MNVFVIFTQNFYYENMIERVLDSDISDIYLFKTKDLAQYHLKFYIEHFYKCFNQKDIITTERTDDSFVAKYKIGEIIYKKIIKLHEREIF